MIRARHDVHDLADDLKKIAIRAPKDMLGVVREGIRTGGLLARDNARRTARRHGRHYPRSITWEMGGFGFAFGVYRGEYGPDPSKKQGGMSFERGSRNQPAHRDLARSADVIGPAFSREVRELPDGWFWS